MQIQPPVIHTKSKDLADSFRIRFALLASERRNDNRPSEILRHKDRLRDLVSQMKSLINEV